MLAQRRIFLAAVGVVVLVLVSSLALTVARNWQYNLERDRLTSLMRSLDERRPIDIDAAQWQAGIDWTITAIVNIFFNQESTPREVMSRFGNQLEARLSDPVDLSTFDWIWDRLAETGPSGRRYVDRFRSVMHETMLVAAPQSDRSPLP